MRIMLVGETSSRAMIWKGVNRGGSNIFRFASEFGHCDQPNAHSRTAPANRAPFLGMPKLAFKSFVTGRVLRVGRRISLVEGALLVENNRVHGLARFRGKGKQLKTIEFLNCRDIEGI